MKPVIINTFFEFTDNIGMVVASSSATHNFSADRIIEVEREREREREREIRRERSGERERERDFLIPDELEVRLMFID